MTDDLILVRVPGWLLARDRDGGDATWRRSENFYPLRPGPIFAPCQPRLQPAARQPHRPLTTTALTLLETHP